MGDARAKLVVPVVEQCPSGGMEECVPPHVALPDRPIRDAGQVQRSAASLTSRWDAG
jgi:hypothetical protein